MRVLVTGGAGFIGSHLVDELLSAGHQVWVLDDFNDFYPVKIKEVNVKGHQAHGDRYRLSRLDIGDGPALEAVFQAGDFEAVIHLAARAGVRPSLDNPALYYQVNVMGTLNILEAARKYGVGRVVFASSSSVYGNCQAPVFSEDLKLAEPISPYAATKLAGEHLAYVYSKLYGLQVVCLRFFTVYGPRQRPDLAIAKFVQLIERGRPVPMYGDGSTSRDYTYIGDIIQGLVAALHYRQSPYEVINLGGGEPVQLKDMITTIGRMLDRPATVLELPRQPGDVDKTAADISKAARLLNYRPATGFRQGLERFRAWLETEAGHIYLAKNRYESE